MSGNSRKLGDGTIAQAVVILSEDGDIADPVPFLQQDLIGSAMSFYPDKIRGFVFGHRPSIANTTVDLWTGPTDIYVFPITPIRMRIVSSSANDTANGTGVHQVQLHYLDSKYQPYLETVTLNGVTPVLTAATNILRVNGLHSVAVGSLGVSAGDISVTNVGATVTYCHQGVGQNTARNGIYTVPDGMWGYINHWQASSGSTGNHFCQVTLRATCHDSQSWPGVFLVQDEAGTQNGGYPIDFPIPIPIPPRTDVKLSAIGDAQNAGITAMGAIMGWFEPIVA